MSGRDGPERRGPERPGPDYPPEWDNEPDELGLTPAEWDHLTRATSANLERAIDEWHEQQHPVWVEACDQCADRAARLEQQERMP